MPDENIQRQRHQENLGAIGQLDRRIDLLSSRVDKLDDQIGSVKNDTRHLDECLDRFQAVFADMTGKFTTMYNALKFVHSPREWARENWIIVIVLLVLLGLVPNVPIWLHSVISDILGVGAGRG